jgi:hypothetical protein
MRTRSSNLPQAHLPSVGLVLTGKVVLQETHQVLEHVHVQAPAASFAAHHAEALQEQGPVLGCQFFPVPLARVGDEAAPAGRRAIS